MTPRVRDILNRLKWETRLDKDVQLYISDRINPAGFKVYAGNEIKRIGHREFETHAGVTIPLYKITKIERAGEVIWVRVPVSD